MKLHVLLTALALTTLPLACDKGDKADSEDSADAKTEASSEKSGDKKVEKGKPFEVDWTKDNEFTVKGDDKQKGSITIFKGIYQVTLRKFPKGTRWQVGEKKGQISSSSLAIVKVKDMADQFGTVAIDQTRETTLDPKASLEIIRPDGTHAKIKLPGAKINMSLKHVMHKVENGPVKFASDGEDTKPGTSIMYIRTFTPKVFGQASTLSDVDAVAIARLLPETKKTKKCSGYKDKKKKPMPDITLELKETEVIVYDRRKGGVISKKVLPPDNSCPRFTFTRQGENKKDSSIPYKAVEAWLRTQGK